MQLHNSKGDLVEINVRNVPPPPPPPPVMHTVTLTLSQEELNIIGELAGSVAGGGKAREVCYQLYHGLKEFRTTPYRTYFSGNVAALP